MHAIIKTVLLISLGITSAMALAGPDWDVINRARAAGQQRNAAATAALAKEAMLARCDEMMKQMDAHPMSGGKDSQPMTSPKGPAEVK